MENYDVAAIGDGELRTGIAKSPYLALRRVVGNTPMLARYLILRGRLFGRSDVDTPWRAEYEQGADSSDSTRHD